MPPLRILVISSDTAVTEAFVGVLQPGCAVRQVELAPAALRMAIEELPDVVLLDCRGDPDLGIQLCRSLRASAETSLTPVAVLSARDDEQTRIAAFEAGADDYFTLASSPREIILRLQAAARRGERPAEPSRLAYADVELDLQQCKAWRRRIFIPLTSMQLRLLRHFLEHPTVVFSREQLLEAVWNNTELDVRAVTKCVERLRRSLNSVGGPELIRSVPGFGYALDCDAAPPKAAESVRPPNISKL